MEKTVNLPEEIINQIITSPRLDLKSMIKCMVVSKQWRNLVSDHISNHPKGHFLVYDFRQSSRSRFGALDDETNQISWMYGEPHLKFVLQFMSSCNGLVCYLAYHCNDISMCNPLTGEYISIPGPQPPIHQCILGFCSSSNEYKLTCLTLHTIETYTLGSSAGWRSAPPFDHQKRWIRSRVAICVNGVLHWLIHRTKSIVTFDLAKEVRGSIPLPHLEDDKTTYKLECMDHCLVLTAGNPLLGLEIWVRQEDKSSGESVWTKNWVIEASQPLIQVDLDLLVPQKLSTDGLIILGDHDGKLYRYDSRDKLVRHHWKCGIFRQLCSYYTPSFISPKNQRLRRVQD